MGQFHLMNKSKRAQVLQLIPTISRQNKRVISSVVFTFVLTWVVWNTSLLFSRTFNSAESHSEDKKVWEVANQNCNATYVKFQKYEPFLTAEHDGRLGNQMFLYATLYAISKQRNRPAYTSPFMTKHISKYFDVSLCAFPSELYPRVNWTKVVLYTDMTLSSNALANIPRKHVRINGYVESWKYFEEYHSEIRKEFKFKSRIKKIADFKISKLTQGSETGPRVNVGVHVRRTDYVSFSQVMRIQLPTLKYYLGAMSYFTEKYDNVNFIIVSDDIKWCIENLSPLSQLHHLNIKFLKGSNVENGGIDLAVLASCDHVIFGVGTFGFWGAYLSGGETVFCSDCTSSNTTLMETMRDFRNFVLPEWIGYNRQGQPSSVLAKRN